MVWYEKIAQYLSFSSFSSSKADSSLFVKNTSKMHVLVLLYANNMIVTWNDEHEVSKRRETLASFV